jgi:AcrR family transcriptional regulator
MPAADRRDMLIETAIETFAKKGFYATTMEEVASAAGITKPVIYQHFESKRALYLAILNHVGTALLSAMSEATQGVMTPYLRFDRGFEAYFRFVYEHKTAFELIFASGPRRDPEFREIVNRVEEQIAEHVTREIHADIDDTHRRLVAAGVQSLAEGIIRRYMREHAKELDVAGEELPFEDSVARIWCRRMSNLMWAGLRGLKRDSSTTED